MRARVSRATLQRLLKLADEATRAALPSRSKSSSSLADASFNCACIAAVFAASGVFLACLAKSPFEATCFFAALLMLGSWGTGLVGVVTGALAALKPTGGGNRFLPLIFNIVVIVGFPAAIKLLSIGPRFRGGPASF